MTKSPIDSRIEIPPHALVIEGQFGTIAIFDLGRQDRATPKNRVVVGGQIAVLGHTQPFSLKGRLRPFLSESLSGAIVGRALAPNERAVVWFAPSDLDASTLLSSEKKAPIAPAVTARLREMAEQLMAEVDLSALQQVSRELLDVQEAEVASGFLRPSIEWEILHDPATTECRQKAIRGLADMAYLEIDDLARALGASVVSVADRISKLPESIEDPEHQLQFSFRAYESSEYVVRPRYRAASGLVADAALIAGIPALDDAQVSLPTLWLDGDTPTASRAMSALCVQGLRLATEDGSIVASLRDPLTSLWDSWPNRSSQVLKSWRPANRESVAQVLKESGVRDLGAICPVAREELLTLVARSPHLLAYALSAFGSDPEHPLSWRRYAASSASGRRAALRIDNYRDAALLALAAETGARPEAATAARLKQASERLLELADQVECLVASGLAEARAMGCTDAAASAVERPLRAAIAAMRAATTERLAGGHAAVELMLAALVGAGVGATPDTLRRAEGEE